MDHYVTLIAIFACGLIFGASVGTCIAAILAANRREAEERRSAMRGGYEPREAFHRAQLRAAHARDTEGVAG